MVEAGTSPSPVEAVPQRVGFIRRYAAEIGAVAGFSTVFTGGGVAFSPNIFAASSAGALGDVAPAPEAGGSPAPHFTIETTRDNYGNNCEPHHRGSAGWIVQFTEGNAKRRATTIGGQVVSVSKTGAKGELEPRTVMPKSNNFEFGEAWALVYNGQQHNLPPGKQNVVYKIKVAGDPNVIKLRSTIPACD